MSIDQASLNMLQAMANPKSQLTALKEYRDGLQNKLEQATRNQTTVNADNQTNNASSDRKQVIVELQAADKQLQQTIYEEETRKLELERLKREAAMAKNQRQRAKALANHERALTNASTGKLLSAAIKNSQYQASGGTEPSLSLISPSPAEATGSQSPQSGFASKAAEIQSDLKEAVDYGIEAAEVARRRKDAEIKAAGEEAAEKKAKKAKRRTVNIMI